MQIILARYQFDEEAAASCAAVISSASNGRVIVTDLPLNDESPGDSCRRVHEAVESLHAGAIVLAAPIETCLSIASVLKEQPAPCPVVCVTKGSKPEDLLALLSEGIAEYLLYPFILAEAVPRLRRALSRQRTEEVANNLSGHSTHILVGRSAPFLESVRKVPPVAACDSTVLITGESGTGKEVFARTIHALSKRQSRPFSAVDCAALPTELIENELFGHERGAYTGAMTRQEGLVRACEGGTLFLDEVDCLPLPAQAKLLRLLQDRVYRPLGSTRTHPADIRILAASNASLRQLLRTGLFRQDLFYRLNVVALHLPPLRDRTEDIPLLARHFVRKYCDLFNKEIASLSPGAVLRLMMHSWPGNVRELEHVIERAVVFCTNPRVESSDIDFLEEGRSEPESLREAKTRVIASFEQKYLHTMLQTFEGNVSRAAAAAHKHRRAFLQLLKRYQIDPDQFRPLKRQQKRV